MEKVYIAVVNQNHAADVPHQDIPGTDLACIVKVRRDSNLSSHVVTDKDLQAAKLTDEELFDLAYPSISPEHFYIRPIEQVISGDNREELTTDSTSDIPHHTIYVVSNEEGLDGASILANPAAMQHIQSRFGGSELMVIPSSVHDYHAKSGIIHSEVMLPPNAPQAYRSPEKLWSSLECAEKSPQAKLGLSIVAAIPNEIPEEQQIALAKEFCQQFVDLGCCVQFAIHDPVARDDRGIPINAQGFPAKSPEEYQHLNPHLHCLICQRMLDENGKWLARTACQYIAQDMHTGDVRSMTAQELKAAGDRRQKQYRYDTGIQIQWMTKQEAICMGYERINRVPRMTRHGISTPASSYVNSPQFLHDMRLHWQDTVNHCLDRYAPSVSERIDMRSYKEQRNSKIPQQHLGTYAIRKERKYARYATEGKDIAHTLSGYLASLNREIRRHNHMIDVYAAQEQEARQIIQEAERQAALLEVYRKQWISSRAYDLALAKQFQQLDTDTEQLRERLEAFQTESSKISSNMMRIRSENSDLSADLENTQRHSDRRKLEKQIQRNNALLQKGSQLLQELRIQYGYEDESIFRKEQQLLNEATRQTKQKEKLLHAAKRQSAETKEHYLKQKALVPVKIRHLVTNYQAQYRQKSSAAQIAADIGTTLTLVLQVEQSILQEEERIEWQQSHQQ